MLEKHNLREENGWGGRISLYTIILLVDSIPQGTVMYLETKLWEYASYLFINFFVLCNLTSYDKYSEYFEDIYSDF